MKYIGIVLQNTDITRMIPGRAGIFPLLELTFSKAFYFKCIQERSRRSTRIAI